MVKVSIRLDVRYKHRDGSYPLKIAIARKKTMYIPLGLSVRPENWNKDKGEIRNSVPNAKVLNALIRQKVSDVEIKVLKLQTEGELRLLSDNELLDALKGDNEKTNVLFSDVLEKFLSLKQIEGTKKHYITFYHKLQKFCPNKNLRITDITYSWVENYLMFLNQTDLKINTKASYITCLKSITNYALRDGMLKKNPFLGIQIQKQETRKRSLTKEEFKKLMSLKLTQIEQKYRDCFLLTFYLIGINLVDLSTLTEIHNNYISYYRRKTNRYYHIEVMPEAREIIEKYRGKKFLLNWFDNIRDYTSFSTSSTHILHRIGESIGVKGLTLYWARHSWASFAAELDIPDDTISRALGHSYSTGAQITQVYIKRNEKKVSEANRKVIDFVKN